MGAFFGGGLDLAAGFDGALLACGLVDMAGFLTFSTTFATGLACFAAGFTTGFAAFLATGTALTGLAAGFFDFCKGMKMSPLAKNLSVTTTQALMIQPAPASSKGRGSKNQGAKNAQRKEGQLDSRQAVWANIWGAVLAGSGRLF